MMARSTTRSKQRPDTLMQDRSPPSRRNLLATHGRTMHTGQNRRSALAEQKFRRCPLCAGSGSKVSRCRRFAMQPLGIHPPKAKGAARQSACRCPNVATGRIGSGPSSAFRSPPGVLSLHELEVASIHRNAPMDSAESPRGTVVGSNPASPHLKPTGLESVPTR
jgi:hypothetical protein